MTRYARNCYILEHFPVAGRKKVINVGLYRLDKAFPAQLQPALLRAFQISRVRHFWLGLLPENAEREPIGEGSEHDKKWTTTSNEELDRREDDSDDTQREVLDRGQVKGYFYN
jgi:hypothetical protein